MRRPTIYCGLRGKEQPDSLSADFFWPVLQAVELPLSCKLFSTECVFVFTSTFAVESALNQKITIEKDRLLAAVGAQTAKYLQTQLNLKDDAVMFLPSHLQREGLLGILESLLACGQKNIVVFCAADGVSEKIAAIFSERMQINLQYCYKAAENLAVPFPPLNREGLLSPGAIFQCHSGGVLQVVVARLLAMFNRKHVSELPPTILFDLKKNLARQEAEKIGMLKQQLL